MSSPFQHVKKNLVHGDRIPFAVLALLSGIWLISQIGRSICDYWDKGSKAVLILTILAICTLTFTRFRRNTVFYAEPGMPAVSRSRKILDIVASVICCSFGTISLIGTTLFPTPPTGIAGGCSMTLCKTMTLISTFILLWAAYPMLLNIFDWLTVCFERKDEAVPRKIGPMKSFLLFALVGLIAFLPYIILCWPGNMSSDSLVQWAQAKNLNALTDNHPFLYTLLIHYLQKVADTPASVSLFQAGTYILLFAWISAWFYRHRAPLWLLILLNLLPLHPNTGILVLTLWKDIAYTLAVIWATFELIQFCMAEKEHRNCTWILIRLTISALLMAAMRHNGLVPAVFILIFLAWTGVARKQLRIIASVCLLAGILCLFVGKPLLSRYLHVGKPASVLYYMPIYRAFAAMEVYDSGTSEQTRQMMISVLPMDVWKTDYSPCDLNMLLHGRSPRKSLPPGWIGPQIVMQYVRECLAHPVTAVWEKMMSSEVAWSTPFMHRFSYSTFTLGGLPGHWTLKSAFPQLQQQFMRQFSNQHRFKLYAIISWRVGLYIMILLGAVWSLCRRKQYAAILPLLPVFGSLLSVIMVCHAPDYRYVYCVYPIFFIYMIFILASLPPYRKESERE